MLTHGYNLQQSCTYPLEPLLQAEYEILELLRREGVTMADRKCRKLPTGEVEWSPTVQMARERIELWGLILKKKEGKKVSSSLIQRSLHKFSIVLRLRDTSIEQILTFKQTALHAYR